MQQSFRSYVIVLGFMLVIWWLNIYAGDHSLNRQNSGRKFTPSCQEGLSPAGQQPTMPKGSESFRFDDVIDTSQGDLYRIMFLYKSEKNENLKIKLSGSFDQEIVIEEFITDKSEKYLFFEKVVSSPGKYSDIVVEATENAVKGDIDIKDLSISRLNQQTGSGLRDTIYGITNTEVINQQQKYKASKIFSHLRDPDVMLGQTFVADNEYVTAVVLELSQFGKLYGDEFKLELREIKRKKDGSLNIQTQLSAEYFFDGCSMAGYHLKNNLYMFPLAASVVKGQEYFIGIRNDEANPTYESYLQVLGARSGEAYPSGTAFLKSGDDVRELEGDLFFKIYGAHFSDGVGGKLMTGQVMEDLGGGTGRFRYSLNHQTTDLLDVFEKTKDVYFDSGDHVIKGVPDNGSNYLYQLDIGSQLDEVRIWATAEKNLSALTTLQISFDNKNWTDIPSSNSSGDKIFDDIVPDGGNQSVIFLKVSYQKDIKRKKADRYGLNDLKINGKFLVN